MHRKPASGRVGGRIIKTPEAFVAVAAIRRGIELATGGSTSHCLSLSSSMDPACCGLACAIGRPKAARGQASRFSCYMSLEHCCCIKVLQTTLPKRKRRIALAFLYCTLKSELIMKLKLRAPNRSSNDCAPEREVSGACKCLFMPASSKPLGLALSSLSPSSCNNGNNDNKLELNQAKFRSTLLLLLLLLVSVC